MARTNLSQPITLIVGLVAIILTIKWVQSNPGGIKGLMTSIDNIISGIFAIPPTSATTPPPPVTPPAPVPPAPAPTPAAAKTCAQRVGEACTCPTCCGGDGCSNGGKIIDEPSSAGGGKCRCACNEPCPGGEDDDDDSGDGDDDDDDDGNGGGGGGSDDARRRNIVNPSQDPLVKKLNQCSGTTGATYKSCVGSLAHVLTPSHTLANQRKAFHGKIFRVGNIR